MESQYLPQEWPGIHYLGQEEIDAVTRVLKSQSLFRYYGPDPQHETEKFEAEFAGFTGHKYCLAVSSGTAALQVALAALGVGVGDEVIVPGYFWVSTVGAVVRSGAIPVLADVDSSFCMDPESLNLKISSRTKAVIFVPMGGVIGKVEEVAAVCKEKGIPLMEDCAQAVGATRFGKQAGSFGDIAVYSFQVNKNMTAGEGGAVATNDEVLYKKSIAAHDLGVPKDNQGNMIMDDPQYQLWGIGVRMSEVTAAILRVQLKKLPSIVASMRGFKYEIKKLLAGLPGVSTRTVADPDGDSGGFLKIIFDDPARSLQFRQALLDNGIKVRQAGFYPIHMSDWGLHIYYKIPGLANKRSINGHHSVWELQENSFAREYTYQKGLLPQLDSYVERTVLFCIASKLEQHHKDLIINAFKKAIEELESIAYG